MIIHCGCKQETQDRLYGRGQRVANVVNGSQSSVVVVRCTACGHDVNTALHRGAKFKTGGGSGKNRFWFDSAEKIRAQFNKNRKVGLRF